MNENQLRARVAELRGWRDIRVMATGDWVGTSPRGVAGKRVPDYTGDIETARKLKKIIEEGGCWVGVRPPAVPGGMVRVRIDLKGWGSPAPSAPGGIYEDASEAMAICRGFVVWAEWKNAQKYPG